MDDKLTTKQWNLRTSKICMYVYDMLLSKSTQIKQLTENVASRKMVRCAEKLAGKNQ